MSIKVIEKAKLKTRKIDIKLNDQLSSDIFVQSLDYFPLIFISKINDPDPEPVSGTTISPKDVIYIKLFNNRFLPAIELYCDDSKGILFNDFYPLDHDTILSIFVKSNSELFMPIRMDFRITEYETIKADDQSNFYRYLITGILDVDDLHYTRYESRKGTSYKVLKDIALEMNLGWASNVQDSNDEMKWINPSDTYKEFIRDITRYSFITENSFIWTSIDFYYNLNYIDVQGEMNEFIQNDLQSMSNKQINKDDIEKLVPIFLTNNNAFNMTNIFIKKFTLLNQSFKVNLEKFYRMKGTWYNKNENTVYKQFITELESDQYKLNKDEGSLLQLLDKKSQIYNENINDEYFIGKIDTDNVHKNYSLAKVSNKFNLDSMEKMRMVLILNQINFSIKRFQNIRIEIYNPDDIFSRDANTKLPLDNINKRLSGFWYVTGINYIFRRDGGNEQEITVVRRDLSLNYGEGRNEKNEFRKLIKK